MTDTVTIAIVSFILGAVFIEVARVYIKRPKGYVRIKHKGLGETEISGGRATQGRESAPALRSKFDNLFNHKSDRETPKVDLADVEKSFQPDPKPEAQEAPAGLQNRYLDLSHLAASDNPTTETMPTQQQPQYTPYSQPPQSMANPQITPATGYTPPVSPPAVHAQTPPVTLPVGEPKAAKDEKGQEWKPMGFFDD